MSDTDPTRHPLAIALHIRDAVRRVSSPKVAA